MKITTNVNSLRAQRAVSNRSRTVQKSQRKLSSGKRIVSSGDDAASLSISNKMSGTIRSQRQALRNANDSISFFQTAEGSLSEMSKVMTRMRELMVQSASGTIGDSERKMLDIEVQQLKKEINRINSSTEALGQKVFDGKSSIQVMIDSHDESSSYLTINLSDLSQNTHALGIYDIKADSALQAQYSLDKLDYGIDKLNESRAKLGSYQNRVTHAANNLGTKDQNLSSANSKLIDLDYASETALQAKNQTLLQGATSILRATNLNPQNVLKLLG